MAVRPDVGHGEKVHTQRVMLGLMRLRRAARRAFSWHAIKVGISMVPLVLLCSCFSGKFFRGADDLIAYNIAPVNASIQVAGTQRYTASGTFGDYSTGDVTSQSTWNSSDPRIVTIDSTGLARGVSAGTVSITGTCQAYSVNTTLTVTTQTKTLSSIAVTPANPSIALGSTQQFVASGTYSDGTTAVITDAVTWTSSNPSAATISATGLATAVTSGNTTIGAALSGVTGSSTLIVQ